MQRVDPSEFLEESRVEVLAALKEGRNSLNQADLHIDPEASQELARLIRLLEQPYIAANYPPEQQPLVSALRYLHLQEGLRCALGNYVRLGENDKFINLFATCPDLMTPQFCMQTIQITERLAYCCGNTTVMDFLRAFYGNGVQPPLGYAASLASDKDLAERFRTILNNSQQALALRNAVPETIRTMLDELQEAFADGADPTLPDLQQGFQNCIRLLAYQHQAQALQTLLSHPMAARLLPTHNAKVFKSFCRTIYAAAFDGCAEIPADIPLEESEAVFTVLRGMISDYGDPALFFPCSAQYMQLAETALKSMGAIAIDDLTEMQRSRVGELTLRLWQNLKSLQAGMLGLLEIPQARVNVLKALLWSGQKELFQQEFDQLKGWLRSEPQHVEELRDLKLEMQALHASAANLAPAAAAFDVGVIQVRQPVTVVGEAHINQPVRSGANAHEAPQPSPEGLSAAFP